MAATVVIVTVVIVLMTSSHGLNNGLARIPPMGWLSWERFECGQDCVSDPDSCIGWCGKGKHPAACHIISEGDIVAIFVFIVSDIIPGTEHAVIFISKERLLRRVADRLVSDGYRDAGYVYVTVDDCWLDPERDSQGRIQPDRTRFPSGMKNLSDYIHSKGLKLGLYEDVGTHTCQGFPGTLDHYEQDANTLAEWGVDMLKFDGCNANVEQYNYGFPAMGHYLNKTGRPILYSCEWPLYMRSLGAKPNYTAVAETCNTWRVYGDIYDSFESIRSIVGWYGSNEGNFTEVAGPGNYNDPDMITLGNFGLSQDEERIQMGMWAMWAAPLFMSVDLSTVPDISRKLLQNKRVLAINQDPAGIQGRKVLSIWVRPLTPSGSYAIAALYLKRQGYPLHVEMPLSSLGLKSPKGYNLTEVFDGYYLGNYPASQNFTFVVNPSGLSLIRAEP